MKLASVETYLAALPDGLRSHPRCAHKGEALESWLARSPTAGLAQHLPPPIAGLLDPRGERPSWVPDVHANALYLAIRESQFVDDDSFLQHALECNRAVLRTPANRLIFWAGTPRAILRAAEQRWASLHRGSSLEVRMLSDTAAEVVLCFPYNLFPEIVLRGNATGFRAALENAGARSVHVELRALDPTHARFAGHWV